MRKTVNILLIFLLSFLVISCSNSGFIKCKALYLDSGIGPIINAQYEVGEYEVHEYKDDEGNLYYLSAHSICTTTNRDSYLSYYNNITYIELTYNGFVGYVKYEKVPLINVESRTVKLEQKFVRSDNLKPVYGIDPNNKNVIKLVEKNGLFIYETTELYGKFGDLHKLNNNNNTEYGYGENAEIMYEKLI